MKHSCYYLCFLRTVVVWLAAVTTLAAAIDENLVKQLLDENESQVARERLQNMADPAAGQVLRDALAKTTGPIRAGIIDSLGIRSESASVPVIAPFLRDTDPLVARTAAAALGRIGDAPSVAALKAARAVVPEAIRPSVVSALLASAGKMAANGDAKGAHALYAEIYDGSKDDGVRTGAYRGMILTDPSKAEKLMSDGLNSKDRGTLLASLQLAGDLPGDSVTKTLNGALPKAPPHIQVALIAALVQRKATTAVTAIVPLAASEDAGMRMVARDALGRLGDEKVIPVMLSKVDPALEAEKKNALQSLVLLRGQKVSDALVAALPKAAPYQQEILLNAMRDRFDSAVGPGLFRLAKNVDEKMRIVLFKTLETVGGDALVADLVQYMKATTSEGERGQLANVISAIARRSDKKAIVAAPVLAALNGADPSLKIPLYNVCAHLAAADVRQALVIGTRDADTQVQQAAIRSLGALLDISSWNELLALAKDAKPLVNKILAIQGCLRLAEQSSLPPSQRLTMYRAIIPLVERPDEKRWVCSSLAGLPLPETLALVEPMLKDEPVKREAFNSYWHIVRSITGAHPSAALTGARLLVTVAEPNQVAEIQSHIRAVEAQIAREKK